MAETETLPTRPARAGKLPGVSPNVLLLRDELRDKSMEAVAQFGLRQHRVEIAAGRDSLWAIIRREGRDGGIALRAAHAPGGCIAVETLRPREGEALRVRFTCAIGTQTVVIRAHEDEVPILRVTTSLRPESLNAATPFDPIKPAPPVTNNIPKSLPDLCDPVLP